MLLNRLAGFECEPQDTAVFVNEKWFCMGIFIVENQVVV
jgi:hypothetical protein